MRKYVTVLLCGIAPLVGMCQQKQGGATTNRTITTTRVLPSDARGKKVDEVLAPAPRFIDHVMLSSEVNADGTVTSDDIVVPEGKPVHLTVYLRESPPGLQTSAVWMNDRDAKLKVERKEMNGAKVATFTLPDRLKPGKYKVITYWGGNFGGEREFEVIGKELGKGKKVTAASPVKKKSAK